MMITTRQWVMVAKITILKYPLTRDGHLCKHYEHTTFVRVAVFFLGTQCPWKKIDFGATTINKREGYEGLKKTQNNTTAIHLSEGGDKYRETKASLTIIL